MTFSSLSSSFRSQPNISVQDFRMLLRASAPNLDTTTLDLVEAVAMEALPASGRLSARSQAKAERCFRRLVQSQPACTKPVQLDHNITSIPDVPTVFSDCSWMRPFHGPIWSTATKERDYDPRERNCVLANLRQLADTQRPDWTRLIHAGEDYKLVMALEQLACSYVYHTPQQGDLVEVATCEGVQQYRVDVIELFEGVKAYGFVAEGGSSPNLLVFRGTSFYPAGRAAAATWLADLDPRGAGHGAYQSGHAAVRRWLDAHSDREVLASGHSLGSALAAEAINASPDRIARVYSFGSIMVGTRVANQIQEQGVADRLYRFYGAKDRVSDYGQQPIGQEFEVHQDPSDELPENEQNNVWRSKSWHHRQSYLNRRCVVIKPEEQRRSKLRIPLLKMVLSLAFSIFWVLFHLKRGLVGAREQYSWGSRVWRILRPT